MSIPVEQAMLNPALRAAYLETLAREGKGAPKGRSKYQVAAKEKRTADRILFDSAHEMRVYLGLKETIREDEKLLVHVRWPLLSDALRIGKLPRGLYFEPDFSIVRAAGVAGWRLVRAVEAKCPARFAPREYKLRAEAFRSSYGVELETIYMEERGR